MKYTFPMAEAEVTVVHRVMALGLREPVGVHLILKGGEFREATVDFDLTVVQAFELVGKLVEAINQGGAELATLKRQLETLDSVEGKAT